jgi:hypothetical protein
MSMKHEQLCSIVNDPSGIDDWSECQCLLIELVSDVVINECIDVMYTDCKHTKVLGREPCTHDYMAARLDAMLTDKP